MTLLKIVASLQNVKSVSLPKLPNIFCLYASTYLIIKRAFQSQSVFILHNIETQNIEHSRQVVAILLLQHNHNSRKFSNVKNQLCLYSSKINSYFQEQSF